MENIMILLCLIFSITSGKKLKYTVNENIKVPSVIGNAYVDLKIDKITKSWIIDPETEKFKNESENLISIQFSTGNIIVSRPIDREKICKKSKICSKRYQLLIERLNEKTAHTVTLIIKDENDNIPHFTQNMVRISIPENAVIGSLYSLPDAIDEDTEKHSKLTYRIVSSFLKPNSDIIHFKLDTSSKFSLDYDADIGSQVYLTIKEPLDRELQNFHTIYVLVHQHSHSSKIENQQNFLNLTFNSKNNERIYWLNDKKTIQNIILKVDIEITDINDNLPKFSNFEYFTSISESSPIETKVFIAKAYDPDSPTHSDIMYNIIPQKGKSLPFSIDKSSGMVILVKKLDRETRDSYKFQVNSLHPSAKIENYSKDKIKMTKYTLNVKVTDVNDNFPDIELLPANYFDKKIKRKIDLQLIKNGIYVNESSHIGSSIALISVCDADFGINSFMNCNLKIEPELTKSNKYIKNFRKTDFKFKPNIVDFKNRKIYNLYINHVLDMEICAKYKINITCNDQHTALGKRNQLKSWIIFNINILDNNDNVPVFDKKVYYLQKPRNTTSFNSSVLTVRARDDDAGKYGKISYSLDKKLNKYFTIDSNGTINLRKINYTNFKNFNFSSYSNKIPRHGYVYATDIGHNEGIASIFVHNYDEPITIFASYLFGNHKTNVLILSLILSLTLLVIIAVCTALIIRRIKRNKLNNSNTFFNFWGFLRQNSGKYVVNGHSNNSMLKNAPSNTNTQSNSSNNTDCPNSKFIDNDADSMNHEPIPNSHNFTQNLLKFENLVKEIDNKIKCNECNETVYNPVFLTLDSPQKFSRHIDACNNLNSTEIYKQNSYNSENHSDSGKGSNEGKISPLELIHDASNHYSYTAASFV
ncbi:hypothetical protein A3Q56_05970 [Intoshia linei]|uniref:Cadherin domain-containing protein n=1 Tax=Intoshia linei TaxID=1819745 RepID=A0A177AWS9_9BILA|nr:hypothetical protein A3Q56_05970 [Intoshia linei]